MRISISAPLLRLRSDEQLLALFRAGDAEAFRTIHDRYRARILAYVRQMLGASRADAEDVLQDVFLRAYSALRADDRPVALRAWLYRVAHNRCIDQLRRPAPAPADVFEVSRTPACDPPAETQRREDLRRLVQDVQRLPGQQRSVLLMREMEGLSYSELAGAIDTTVPAVKSLLVRARMGLVEAAEARDTACVEVRRDLAAAHGRGVRASGRARRHLRDCAGCREFRDELRRRQRVLAGLSPVGAGPLALIGKLIGGSVVAAALVTSGAGVGELRSRLDPPAHVTAKPSARGLHASPALVRTLAAPATAPAAARPRAAGAPERSAAVRSSDRDRAARRELDRLHPDELAPSSGATDGPKTIASPAPAVEAPAEAASRPPATLADQVGSAVPAAGAIAVKPLPAADAPPQQASPDERQG